MPVAPNSEYIKWISKEKIEKAISLIGKSFTTGKFNWIVQPLLKSYRKKLSIWIFTLKYISCKLHDILTALTLTNQLQYFELVNVGVGMQCSLHKFLKMDIRNEPLFFLTIIYYNYSRSSSKWHHRGAKRCPYLELTAYSCMRIWKHRVCMGV